MISSSTTYYNKCLNLIFGLLLLNLFINIILCEDNNETNSTTILKRQRRYLLFPKGSRNAIRINFKHNRVVPITSILAYSDGMRLQWDLPTKVDDLRPKFRRSQQRRDIFEFLEQAMTTYGLDGESCIMRALCETTKQNSPVTGLVSKMLHLIFMIPEDEKMEHDDKYVQHDHHVCHKFIQNCPFSLLGPTQVLPLHETNPLD